MTRLLSVNVGLPRDVSWEGKVVHTAIWKSPVQGSPGIRDFKIFSSWPRRVIFL
jgi:hypothetical protein